MKFKHVTDIEGFFNAVSKCTGRVELVTDEGDRLNLKSQLTQYLTMAKVFGGSDIPEMEVVVSNADDMGLLLSFMMAG